MAQGGVFQVYQPTKGELWQGTRKGDRICPSCLAVAGHFQQVSSWCERSKWNQLCSRETLGPYSLGVRKRGHGLNPGMGISVSGRRAFQASQLNKGFIIIKKSIGREDKEEREQLKTFQTFMRLEGFAVGGVPVYFQAWVVTR